MAQLYEGPSKEIRLGANGPTYSDGGGIEGGMTWVSPKYKGNAGKKVGIGGEIVRDDADFKESSYVSTESTNIKFKQGSILDETQRIIDSQPQGGKRLQHVGNAIDQVSKVFNDGYKELTKGSRVLAYVGDIGQEKGAEYCRVFSKDTPYLQYNDLQKTDGMTTEGRRFSYSVLDKTYNLNMYPNKREGGQDSTNLVGGIGEEGRAKKYMFSLENLAWRTSNKPGYTVSDLPVCERGPNGGRVMWFPPYGLTFTEGSTANWKATDFIGRPEPVYTYNNTSRTGSLSWKIVVDHPSVLNVITNKVLAKETNKNRIDSILESFFAGCRKYDLYELAKKYYTVNPNDIFEIQKELQYRDVSTERVKYIKQTVAGDPEVPEVSSTTTAPNIVNPNKYKDLGFYFHNDIPKKDSTVGSFDGYYSQYLDLKPEYSRLSPTVTEPYESSAGQTATFFSDIIEDNFTVIKEMANDLLKLFTTNKTATATLNLIGSASSPQTQKYNLALSQRRIDSVIIFLKNYKIGNTALGSFMENSGDYRFFVKGDPKGELTTVSPKGKQTFKPYNCTKAKDTQTSEQKIYTVNAMACRRVSIDLTVNEIPETTVTITTERKPATPSQEVDVPQTYIDNTKVPEEVTKTVIRDNISKRVLRSLLSECDYFETIKEETPMVFDNLKEKLKFFHPAFHSTTPEGLNSRLTFLQQCMRPGDTIPVVKKDGGLEYNNATNTSFGAPPVLILRVGDFFHTKIIPDNLSLTYENLDLNPEGIGIQPMIANVTLSFKFVGGHGLKGAVDKIQNALTFNYYANTEMYDDRSDVTDTSYQVIDKEFLDYFNITVPPPTVNQVQNNNGQSNGQTVGIITSATTAQSGETGDINYQAYMNGFINSAQQYFTNIFNKNKEVFTQYNNAVMQVWNKERNYTDGSFLINKNNKTFLFGKPKNIESSVDKIFNDFIKDIENNDEGFIKFISDPSKDFKSKAITAIKDNYKNYIKNKKSNFQSSLTKITQDIVTQEQELINNLAKSNLICFGQQNISGSDGLQQSNGYVKLYITSATTKVYDKKYADTLLELVGDNLLISSALTEYYNAIQTVTSFTSGVQYSGTMVTYPEKIPTDKVFVPFSKSPKFNSSDVSFQRCYFILSQDVIDDVKYTTFKQQIIGSLITNPSLFGGGNSDIGTQFDAYWKQDINAENKSPKTLFIEENNITKAFFDYLSANTLKNYLNFTPFNGAKLKKYEFTFYTQTNDPTEGALKDKRESLVKALGASSNQYASTGDWSNQTSTGIIICKVKLN
jgi:hypothetical protein